MAKENESTKIFLDENEAPKRWYNIQADLPKPLPAVLHPATKQPIGPQDLAAIFPMSLIKQEVSTERFIDIPEEVREAYRLYRPTPLVRARRLEKALGTPAKIFFKNESVSPAGSHKPNTSIAQAYYNQKEGTERLTTETGAGQWGSALSFACNLFGLDCTIYMVKCSFEQKPYRKIMMQTYGAEVFPSPSSRTKFGKKVLAQNPNHEGSLGIAISEAIEDAVSGKNTKYSLGSVLNHVLLHQTIIGQETQKQLAIAETEPDIMIGCVGGGSNFAGFAFPFMKQKMDGKQIRFIAVEPEACPSMTRGKYAYDFGDTGKMTPLMKMHTLGHGFIPESIHAGGLRYHGEAPLLSHIIELGLVEPRAYAQIPVFEAAVQFARAEGIIPAPESAHAIRAAIDEATICKKTGEEKTIVFNLSGHGHFDMGAYEAFFAGKLKDTQLDEKDLSKALNDLPKV